MEMIQLTSKEMWCPLCEYLMDFQDDTPKCFQCENCNIEYNIDDNSYKRKVSYYVCYCFEPENNLALFFDLTDFDNKENHIRINVYCENVKDALDKNWWAKINEMIAFY